MIEVLPTADDLHEIQGVYLQLLDAETTSAYFARMDVDSKHLQLYSSPAAASLGGLAGRIGYSQTGPIAVGARLWSPATISSSPVAIGVLSSVDSASEATGISAAGLIGGWSGIGGSSSTQDRAFFTDQVLLTMSAPLRPLNDKHFVHGLSGVILERVTAVNADGSMVARGQANGVERAFLLRRLKSE